MPGRASAATLSTVWARRCRWLGAILMAALAGALLLSALPAMARAPRHVRVGTAPRHPAGSRTIGPLAAKTRLSALVSLKPSDPSALAAYAQAVSTPGSSIYHQHLTVAEFRQQFAPTQTQIQSVESALRASGLRPGSVSANGLLIHVSARAGAFAHAFSTRFQRVKLRAGRTAYANTSAPQLPATVSGYVRGVIGLDSLITPHPLGLASERGSVVTPHAEANVATGGPQPCTAAGNGNTADKIASAYDFSPLYAAGDKGAGQTIAILELEPNTTSDIAAYQSCYGTNTSVNYVSVDGFNQTGPGTGEAALDIEQVIGLAPLATIDVYQAPNTNQSLIDDYTAMVNNSSVNVISTSWGSCEANASTLTQTENTLFMQAAAEGKSVFAASGDNGSVDDDAPACTGTALSVDDPASQ
ncbi:MAG TPA: protease pro-enzyme activation domain-containing protein, partial [Solirubrobacteraceae bacterium]